MLAERKSKLTYSLTVLSGLLKKKQTPQLTELAKTKQKQLIFNFRKIMFQSKHRIKILIVASLLVGWLLVTNLFGADKFWKADMEVRVNGLVCSICATGLKKSFEKHASIEGIKIDIKKGMMLIDFSTGKDGRILFIKNKDIIKMVNKTGYEVRSIKRLGNRKPNRYNKP